MKIEDLTVVVCCTKDDYYFARICIASIRYYYPDMAIELVKDAGKGAFDTREAEKYFNVKNIDLGVKKMGWSAAKILYLYKFPHGKRVLLLDADIVFIGPFIERLLPLVEESDFVVTIEKESDPYAEWVKGIYFDAKKIEQLFPDYKFPGYFFNAGQMFVKTGSVEKKVLNDYFDADNYPYWKCTDLFPLVDQSLYNYLLPTLHNQNKIKLGTAHFMLWSKSNELQNISLDEVVKKQSDAGLIHWAGDKRTPVLNEMNRSDILLFFESFYYQKIPLGQIKRVSRKIIPSGKSVIQKIKRLIR